MNRSIQRSITVPFIVLLFCLALAGGLWGEPHVRAATFIYVRPDGDDVICNGQHDAPVDSAPDCAFATIDRGVTVVDEGGTVVVATGVYTERIGISRDLTLQGAGAESTLVGGDGTGRVFYVNRNKAATISGVTIRNGHSTYGGGIHNRGTLTLTGSMVFSNAATISGGGIFNAYGARMVISDCIISGNSAAEEGAGIFNLNSALSVVRSTVVNNTAGVYGGGIESVGGTLTIEGSTVRENQALGELATGGGFFNDSDATLTNVTLGGNTSNYRGGGIFNQGPMTLTNVTISSNAAGVCGGGMIHAGAFTLTVVNCTVANNAILTGSGAGGINFDSPAILENTLLAHNDNANCDTTGGLISNGHNLDSGDSCSFSAAGDITGTIPLIGPLADNGGPSTGSGQATLTQALLGGSPAIDAGVCVPGVETDQRGVARPYGDECDIGAYEFTGYSVLLPLVQRGR
jgi:hypothetical protein